MIAYVSPARRLLPLAFLLSACGPAETPPPAVLATASAARASASSAVPVSIDLPGFRRDYTITLQGGRATITRNGNAASQTDIDARTIVRFLDRSVALDIDGRPGQLYRLYQAALNRTPDEGGLGFWLSNGGVQVPFEEIARQFAQSDEFTQRYGNQLSDEQFVGRVYGNVLGRTPDDAGLAYWVQALKNGSTRAAVLAYMADSGENRTRVQPAIANGFAFLPFNEASVPAPGEPWNESPSGWTFHYEDYLSANRPWSYAQVDGPAYPVRLGGKSQRFELRNGDCGGTDCGRADGTRERSEMAQDGVKNLDGETWWYGWSFYVPPDYQDAGNLAGTAATVTMAQFHQTPSDPNGSWDPAWMLAKEYNGPFVARRFPTLSGTYPFERFELIPKDKFVGRWHDMVVQATWSEKQDGVLRIWIDGELKLDYDGMTRTPGNKDVYFKYGIYRPATPTRPVNTVIYFDEVRRGRSRQQVDVRMIEQALR